MNTTKSIYNKLFKEETQLASHEVSLGIIDDFANAQSNVQNMYGNGVNKAFEAKPILQDALKLLQMSMPSIDRALKVGMNVEKQIKDLGLDLPPEYNNKKNRLLDDEKRIKGAIALIERVISEIRFK